MAIQIRAKTHTRRLRCNWFLNKFYIGLICTHYPSNWPIYLCMSHYEITNSLITTWHRNGFS